MIVGEVLPRIDHSVHVCLHQICNNVDILVAGLGGGPLHVHQSNNVFVIEEFYKYKNQIMLIFYPKRCVPFDLTYLEA